MTEEDPPDWLDDGPPIDDDAYRPPLGADDVLRSRARERLAEVPRAAPKPPPPIVAPDLAMLCARQPGRYKRIKTYCEDLDASCGGGIQTRRLVVIGGAPGVTKTGWTLAMCRSMALQGVETPDGHVPVFVAFVAADEPRDGLLSRLGQMEGESRGDLEDEDLSVSTMAWARACEGILRMPNLAIFDPREDDMSVERVLDWSVAQAKDRGARLVVVVDSIQVAAFDSDTSSDPKARESTLREKIERRIRTLRRFTIVHDAAVIAISELNRGAYQPGGEATLAAFKEAGGIEYGADLALTIHRVETDDETEHVIEVTPQKNRMGGAGNLKPFRLRRERCLFSHEPMPASDEADARDGGIDDEAVRRAEQAIVVGLITSHAPIYSRPDLAALAKTRNAVAQRAISNLLVAGRVRCAGRGKPYTTKPSEGGADGE